MRHLKLAVLWAAATVVCATTMVLAVNPTKTTTYTLTPPAGSDFPNASGSVTTVLSGPFWGRDSSVNTKYKYYTVDLSLHVRGLTPNSSGYGFDDSVGLLTWFWTDQTGSADISTSIGVLSPNDVPTEFYVVASTNVVELSSQ